MKTAFLSFFGFILLTSCFGPSNTGNNSATTKYNKVHQEEFLVALDSTNGLLIDVRTPGEYSAGHIDGAINIDYFATDFKTQVSSLDLSKPVFVYCQAGGRSGKASKVLFELGATEVYDLIGGYGQFKP
jgi:rhodanese-related sulfurtransferase